MQLTSALSRCQLLRSKNVLLNITITIITDNERASYFYVKDIYIFFFFFIYVTVISLSHFPPWRPVANENSRRLRCCRDF